MNNIKELALRIAEEMPEGFLWSEDCGHEAGIIEQEVIDFATRFLAAYTEGQEPVARLLRYIGNDLYPKQLADDGRVSARSYSELTDGMYPETWEKVAELYTAPPLPAIPDGMVLVPREPTEAMVGNEWNRDMLAGIWKAMIAAGEVTP